MFQRLILFLGVAGEYDIHVARSLDGGLNWGPTVTINPDRGLDHYFPAVDIVDRADRDRVGVSYYRSDRKFPGGSDYVLAGGANVSVPYNFKVVSPIFPPPDGSQASFNGDYSGLTINRGEEAHPIWSDTRNIDPYAPANGVIHDEDVFTDNVRLPAGVGSVGVGQIGKPNSDDQ